MTRKTARPASSKPAKEATNTVLSKSSAGTAALAADASSKPASLRNGSAGPELISAETRRLMIAEAAYYMSAHRGFETGRELEDWLLAEKQIDAVLSGETAGA